MLRKSLLEESQAEWQPSIPTKEAILKQIVDGKGRIGGSERLASMRISVRSKLPSAPRFWFMQLGLRIRGSYHSLRNKINDLLTILKRNV